MDEIIENAMMPGAGSWVDVAEPLRESFAGCPDLPRMSEMLTQMKTAARQAAQDYQDDPRRSIINQESRSFIPPYNRVDLSLSYETTPGGLTYQDCPVLRWHLSMSTVADGHRQPVQQAELAGWVMAGFTEANRYAEYTMATATARHADIPIE